MKINLTPAIFYGSKNEPYIACPVKHTAIIRYLRTLNRLLGDVIYSSYRANQKKRDNNKFHLTIITPDEYIKPGLSSFSIQKNNTFEVHLQGIGRIRKINNVAYYILVHSIQIQEFRGQFGLKPKDLHITLGFNPNDIYDINKGKETLIKTVGNLPL